MTKHVLVHVDYVKRKKQFEEKGRTAYLASDVENFASLTAEFMAFVDTYIDGITDKYLKRDRLFCKTLVTQRQIIKDYESFIEEIKQRVDDNFAEVARGGD